MMEKVWLKPGAKGMVHGQGFNRRSTFTDLTSLRMIMMLRKEVLFFPQYRVRCCWLCPERMMKRDVYVLKKDLESCVIESCVAGAICLMSAKYWGTRLRRGYREKKKKVKRVK